jgi:putative membrane protein
MTFGKPFAALALLAAPAALFAQAMPAPAYLAKAGASDLFERESGQLMAASANPKVRDFAKMMVHDHTQSTAEVKAAAARAHLKVTPAVLTPEQSRDLAALRTASGAARDKLYIEQQKAAHQEALTVQSGYAKDGGVAELKLTAEKIVPVVKHHIEMLAAM